MRALAPKKQHKWPLRIEMPCRWRWFDYVPGTEGEFTVNKEGPERSAGRRDGKLLILKEIVSYSRNLTTSRSMCRIRRVSQIGMAEGNDSLSYSSRTVVQEERGHEQDHRN